MLEIKNITKIYKTKGGQEVRALDGVTLSFEDKGMVFLLGKSGSGKSTLLNVCGGLDFPDSGEIIIKGKSSKDFTPSDYDSYRNTYVGFIFQEYNIIEEFSVEDNIALALELQGKPKDSATISKILKDVELEDFAKRKPNTLSGGQKQRVAIARALIKNPEIIFADEPTGALDSQTGIQVLDTLKKLSQEKLVIVVSHDREFAQKYGDRIIELKDGKVIDDVKKITLSKNGKPLKTPRFEPVISQPVPSKSSEDYSAKEVEFIKSRLPLRHAFKIGISSLRQRPIRFTFTLVMALVAFCLLGLFSCLMFYDEQTVLVQSITDSQADYLKVGKSYYSTTTSYTKDSDEPTSTTMPTGTPMSQKDIELLEDKFGEGIIPIYKLNFCTIDNLSFDEKPMDPELFYSNFIYGFIPSTAKLEYLYGNAPSGNNEIAISYFTYQSILNGILKDFATNNTIENITDYTQIKITINGKNFSVSGVYKNEYIAPQYENMTEDSTPYQNWNSRLYNDLITYAVIDTQSYDYFADLIGEISYFSPVDSFGGMFAFILYEDIKNSSFSNQFIELNNLTFFDNQGNSKTISTCQENAVVMSLTSYFTLIQSIVSTLINPLHANYDENFVSDYRTAYDGNFATILSNLAEGKILNQADILDYGKMVLDIINKYIDIDSIDFNTMSLSNSQAICSDTKLLGFFPATQSQNLTYMSPSLCQLYKDFAISNGNYTSYTSKYVQDTTQEYLYLGAFIPTHNDKNLISDIMSYSFVTHQDDTTYIASNYLINIIYTLSAFIEVLSKVFFWIGLAFAIFTIFIFAGFISSSITKKKKEIGILRALGARGSDILKIFFLESIIIALICIVGANLITAILTPIINSAMSNSLSFNISIFVFGFISVAIITGIAIITSILATILPVYKVSKKKPVDSIRSL